MTDENEEQTKGEVAQMEDLPAEETEAQEVKGGGQTVLAWARVDGVAPK